MFGNPFYNETLRRYVDAFGFLFKDIVIERESSDGLTAQKQIVPIQFSPTEHYLARNTVDPDILRPVAIQLPRLAYELVRIRRSSERQLNPLNKMVCYDENGKPSAHYVPVPYDLSFVLRLKGRHIEDMFKVTDQILPYFAPYFTMKAEMIDGMCPVSINFNLDDVDMLDRYEGPVDQTRELVWTFAFTVNAYFFGPDLVGDDGNLNVIRWVRVNQGVSANEVNSSSNTYPVFAGKTLYEILPTDDYTVVTEDITGTP